MDQTLAVPHRPTLSVSAAQSQPGGSVTLSWKVVGVAANVASVYLGSNIEDSVHMIESVAPQSSREVIFAAPGTFTFTLTATFGDGVKRIWRVSVDVKE
jgi:hypothetical protein